MASRRVLENLIRAVFDGLSDDEESDDAGGNEIYASRMVSQVDLMAANLGGDDGKDQDEQEDYFKHADLMVGSIGIAGNEQDDEVSSTPIVAGTTGSSDSNPDTSAIDHELSDREVLAAYTVRIIPIDQLSCKEISLHRAVTIITTLV